MWIPASLSGRESVEIVLFLISIDKPNQQVITSVSVAIRWFSRLKIAGIRVEEVKAPVEHFKYRTADFERVVVSDPKAPYELGTNTPLFCNRDKKPVYSLAEVERERRVGYSWYTYEPAEVLKKYPAWQRRWSHDDDALEK